MVQKLYEKFGVTAWVVITALLLTYMTMSTVAADADAYNDSSMSAVFLVLLFVALAGAVCVRYIFSSRKDGSKLPPLVWVSVWSLPLLVTLVMLPWLLEGILVDRDVTAIGSIFLFGLIAYGTLLLGFLLVPFVLAPLELIARGVKGISKGDRKNGLSILGIGLYIAAVTAFSFIGGLAIETERFGPAAWPAIIFSLLGLLVLVKRMTILTATRLRSDSL